MGEYGYRYESYSTYNTAGGGRIEEPFASLIKKPFGPFVPNSSNRISESHVPRRKHVPVTTGSYADEYRHCSPTKSYPARDDDYEWHRRTSPVHGRPEFVTKVQNEASRPAGFNPAATDWRQRPHTTAYGDRKEGRNHKPSVRSDSYDSHRDDGYGGNYGYKGHKPIAMPIGNDIYDDENDYSDGEEHSMGPRVFPKSKGPTDGVDNFNRDNGYGGNNYSNKEGHKPIVRNDGYDGYNRDNGGYGGNYGNKEGHKPMGSPIRNDSYDGYQPSGNYGDPKKPAAGGGWTRPIWTAPPKQGSQLTSPTSDINMAIELLKEAANISGSPKATANGYPNDKYDNSHGRNNGVDRPTKESERVKPITTVAPLNSGYKKSEPSNNVGKAMEPPAKEPERIKNALIAPPPQPRTTVPVVEYDNRDAKRFGNFASPRRNITDGRDEAYQKKINRDDPGRYVDSGTIDSRRAATKYNGRLL